MEYPKVCANCGKKYKAKHRRGKFCSDYCRVDFNRKENRTNEKKQPTKKAAPKKKQAQTEKKKKKFLGKASVGITKVSTKQKEKKKTSKSSRVIGKNSDKKRKLPAAEAEFLLDVDTNEVQSAKVTRKSNGKKVSDPHDANFQTVFGMKPEDFPGAPQGGAEVVERKNRPFSAWMALAKSGNLSKQEIDASLLNANQKSMLYAKLKV